MKYIFDSSTLTYFIEKLKEKFSLKTEVTEQINELEKIESSEIEPINEMVSLWINTSEDESTNVVARINDDTVTSNTTWSSEKINASIISGGSGGSDNVDLSSYALKTDLHSHNNKTVLDNITSTKVSEWNNKSTFSGNYNDLTNKPTIPTIPTNISSFTNDSGYITSIPSEYITDSELTAKGYATENYVTTAIDNAQLSGGNGETVDMTKYALKTELPTKTSQLTNDSNFLTSIPTEYVTETELNNKGYLTEHQSLENYAKTSDLHTHDNKSILDNITSDKVTEWNNKSTFSGSYNDLTDKPTIPTDYITEIPSEYITETELNAKGYLTEHQSLDGFATEGYVGTMISEAHEVNIVANQTFSNAYINYLTGEFVSGGTAHACEEYIEIKGGEVYKVLGITNIVRIAYYNSSKSYLNNYIDDTPEFEFTAPTDAQYIRVHIDSTTNLSSSLQIIGTSVHTHKNKAILDSLTSDNLHNHDNKDTLDTITSDMTTKWNQSIPFNDTYVSDCNAWLTNGYIKTGAGQTSNLPSICTGSDRWGILFFIAENATQGTGTQMYFPIDGTYKGRIFTRSLTNMNASGSSVGDWNLLATTNDIATSSVATTSLSVEETSTIETEIEERIISNLSLGIHSDGLLYIFYNENPIGNGININK